MGVHTIAGKEVAIKIEPAVDSKLLSPLMQESKIYKTIAGGPGVPWVLWSGKSGEYNVMVIDLLGPSLEDLFKRCNRHFSLKTVLLLADQLISRIEYIHGRDYVHRDVKPANFVMGRSDDCPQAQDIPLISGSANLVNVIDFGLAKKFRDSRTGDHIPYKQDPHHGVGTSLFAALNTHLGIETSRRDDLESLAYMLIYFIRGTLPWKRIKADSVSVLWDLIRDSKIATANLLTVGLPEEFDILYRYARGLEFDDLPDYEGLRQLLRSLADREGIVYDGVFDWTRRRTASTPSSSVVPSEKKSEKENHLKSRSSEGHKRPNAPARRRTCEACDARREEDIERKREEMVIKRKEMEKRR